MELSGIRGSFGNLFQYITERDNNYDGVIGNAEVSSEEFNRLDIDHNGRIQDSEIMEAANLISPARHFSARDLSQIRRAEGRAIEAQIRLVNPEIIYGMRFNRGSIIAFRGSVVSPVGGYPGTCILPSTNTVINGITFRAGTRVGFNEDGHVCYVILEANTTIYNSNFRQGTMVEFNENGHVSHITPAIDTTINGIRFKAGTLVAFYENGRVERGTLAADTAIGGRLFNAWTLVYFDENGQVTNP